MRGQAVSLFISLILAAQFLSYDFILEQNYPEGKLIVSREAIILFNNKGLSIDRLELTSEVIFDCSVDLEGKQLFCILGDPGNKRGERIAVYSWSKDKLRNIYYGEARYNPWKILLADVDGDSLLDVCVGVWKTTIFDSQYDNRLFIYDWEDERLLPKWLGSRLSSPFLDFGFADIDDDGILELIALELQRNCLKRVMSYKWQSFGFAGFRVLFKNLTAVNLNEVNFKKELIK